MKQYYVYILTNRPQGVLYIGVTNNLARRSFEHSNKTKVSSFTAKYNAVRLVYFEETSNIDAAIQREKQLKNWHRDWKINLIESLNPEWSNLLGSKEILKQVQDDKGLTSDAAL